VACRIGDSLQSTDYWSLAAAAIYLDEALEHFDDDQDLGVFVAGGHEEVEERGGADRQTEELVGGVGGGDQPPRDLGDEVAPKDGRVDSGRRPTSPRLFLDLTCNVGCLAPSCH
jgi:hypothetical protein